MYGQLTPSIARACHRQTLAGSHARIRKLKPRIRKLTSTQIRKLRFGSFDKLTDTDSETKNKGFKTKEDGNSETMIRKLKAQIRKLKPQIRKERQTRIRKPRFGN